TPSRACSWIYSERQALDDGAGSHAAALARLAPDAEGLLAQAVRLPQSIQQPEECVTALSGPHLPPVAVANHGDAESCVLDRPRAVKVDPHHAIIGSVGGCPGVVGDRHARNRFLLAIDQANEEPQAVTRGLVDHLPSSLPHHMLHSFTIRRSAYP